jgi:hypothetical protein
MSFFKKLKKAFIGANKAVIKTASPIDSILGKAGVSESNTLRQVLSPAAAGMRTVDTAYEQGGTDAVKDALRRGDVTDPAGMFHSRGAAHTIAESPPAPTQATAQSAVDTSRQRRRRGVLANIFGVAGRQNTGRITLG